MVGLRGCEALIVRVLECGRGDRFSSSSRIKRSVGLLAGLRGRTAMHAVLGLLLLLLARLAGQFPATNVRLIP